MSEEASLDVEGARAFVNDIIALSSKWSEIDNFLPSYFLRKMLVKPSTKATFAVDDISWTKNQLVCERNLAEMTLIELRETIDRLRGEIFEMKQRLAELGDTTCNQMDGHSRGLC